MYKVTLYKLSANGAMTEWSIQGLNKDHLLITWGQIGGTVQKKSEKVEVNQSGRSLEEQMRLRLESRVNHQLDKGYKYTTFAAFKERNTNASGLLRPMLAQTYDRDKARASKDGWWQYKYNGHRCLITNQGDANIAYSRNGKPIESIPHILDELVIPPGVTLDGELYMHGAALQTISSYVRCYQPNSARLKYIVYDQILDIPFERRLDKLNNYTFAPDMSVAPTERGYSPDMAHKSHLLTVQNMGYEGLMFRDNGTGYEPGKRSSQLNKVKMWHDCEVTVKEVYASKDGWAILDCVDDDSNQFRVSAPGTIADKTEVLNNKDNYLGKRLTVEFAEYTKDNVPFHPVAIAFREDE